MTITSLQAQSRSSNQTTDDPQTPLMRAAAAGRLDEARNLLQAGADVNEELPGIGITVLMIAAARGDLEIVKLLLAAGANPNAAGGVAHAGFWTALTGAMNPQNKNRLELVDTLIAAVAQLNPQPWFPESPLQAAVKANDMLMLKALLQRGSDVLDPVRARHGEFVGPFQGLRKYLLFPRASRKAAHPAIKLRPFGTSKLASKSRSDGLLHRNVMNPGYQRNLRILPGKD